MGCVEAENGGLLAHLLMPVPNEEDALATASALEHYRPERVTTLHVVEKGEGVPDKTTVEQSQEGAATSYAAVRNVFPDTVEPTAYARNVVQAVFEAADEGGASAIAYSPRGGSRLVQLLSGDRSLRLVTEADRPVIALPRGDSTE